jgi:hypothetical protein
VGNWQKCQGFRKHDFAENILGGSRPDAPPYFFIDARDIRPPTRPPAVLSRASMKKLRPDAPPGHIWPGYGQYMAKNEPKNKKKIQNYHYFADWHCSKQKVFQQRNTIDKMFLKEILDFARDGQHPGALTQQAFADQMIKDSTGPAVGFSYV